MSETAGETGRVELLPAQRHATILDYLRTNTVASIQQLAAALGASESTVRRDLRYLVEQGYLERTHGGAIIRHQPETRFEPDPSIAAASARAQKQAIGALAAGAVASGQSLILDASSTVLAAAECILKRQINLTIVTNDLNCAQLFSAGHHGPVIVSGGTIRPASTTLVGEPAQRFLAGIHVDIAFIGVHTISGGIFTETSLEVAGMKQLMIRAAKRVIVLADSSKFGTPSFCEIGRVADVDEVITDDGATADQIEAIRAEGTICTVAGLQPETRGS